MFYNTRDFSKATNSKKNGGAVTYYSSNHELKVDHNSVLRRHHNDQGIAAVTICETGICLICEVVGYEYYDFAKTEIKTYILCPIETCKNVYPEYANVSLHITIYED